MGSPMVDIWFGLGLGLDLGSGSGFESEARIRDRSRETREVGLGFGLVEWESELGSIRSRSDIVGRSPDSLGLNGT